MQLELEKQWGVGHDAKCRISLKVWKVKQQGQGASRSQRVIATGPRVADASNDRLDQALVGSPWPAPPPQAARAGGTRKNKKTH